MEDSPKRPRLIGIIRVVLVLYGLSNCLGLLFFLISSIGGNPYPMPFFSPSYLIRALCAGIAFLIAAHGITRRRTYGRWLAAAMFFFIAATCSYSMFSVALDIPNPAFEFVSKGVMLSINATQVVLFTAATFYLMTSPRVIEYFNPEMDGRITEPPPPPSFDA